MRLTSNPAPISPIPPSRTPDPQPALTPTLAPTPPLGPRRTRGLNERLRAFAVHTLVPSPLSTFKKDLRKWAAASEDRKPAAKLILDARGYSRHTLDLSGVRGALPACIGELAQLKSLKLRHDQLKSLPESMKKNITLVVSDDGLPDLPTARWLKIAAGRRGRSPQLVGRVLIP